MTRERLVYAREFTCGALAAYLHIGAGIDAAATRVKLDVIDLLLALTPATIVTPKRPSSKMTHVAPANADVPMKHPA